MSFVLAPPPMWIAARRVRCSQLTLVSTCSHLGSHLDHVRAHCACTTAAGDGTETQCTDLLRLRLRVGAGQRWRFRVCQVLPLCPSWPGPSHTHRCRALLQWIPKVGKGHIWTFQPQPHSHRGGPRPASSPPDREKVAVPELPSASTAQREELACGCHRAAVNPPAARAHTCSPLEVSIVRGASTDVPACPILNWP